MFIQGLARTPPMGFANWNGFGCNYTDATIRSMADIMVNFGLRDAGYNTIIIQECIVPAGHRNAQGVLEPDPQKVVLASRQLTIKFPFGIANLVDYIHSKGMKAGTICALIFIVDLMQVFTLMLGLKPVRVMKGASGTRRLMQRQVSISFGI
jgi:hypothetical protein